MTRGVVAGALVAVLLVACAVGGQKRSAPMAVAPQSDATMIDGDPRAEIEKLDQNIVAERARLGFTLPPPPPAATAACATCPQPMTTQPLTSKDPICTHGASETCTDVCILSDSICETAGKICDLAGKMTGDQWAADKCTSGKASCTEANAKCCDCK